ncbi:hypothetical protein [Paenibacillus spongiae]|uniref:Uncharacterized protein n=1 Tax=Paenibacillus spongiae TaxID=2909671 RepID=A0ABY5SC64_9BACL|nr:hypothetical protein [Paenibacillus spongiae]UVI31115.1 hypothetical protein L1F29_04520 [Paenibacillus spongiae]
MRAIWDEAGKIHYFSNKEGFSKTPHFMIEEWGKEIDAEFVYHEVKLFDLAAKYQ